MLRAIVLKSARVVCDPAHVLRGDVERLLAGAHESTMATVLGAVAVFASTTNVVSGFLITDRMLKMFKKREVGK